jgi:hypothetical protein
MTKSKYNIKYYGELIPGHEPESIANTLATTFNISKQKARKLLNSSNALLKKDVDLETAELYQKKLFELGLKTYVTEVESLNTVNQKSSQPDSELQSSGPDLSAGQALKSKYHCLSRTSFTARTTFSVLNPKYLKSSPPGADSPYLSRPSTLPLLPTYLYQPALEPASSTTRAGICSGSTRLW